MKKFRCHICPFASITKEKLTQHTTICNNTLVVSKKPNDKELISRQIIDIEKAPKCDICEYTAFDNIDLDIHNTTKHPNLNKLEKYFRKDREVTNEYGKRTYPNDLIPKYEKKFKALVEEKNVKGNDAKALLIDYDKYEIKQELINEFLDSPKM